MNENFPSHDDFIRNILSDKEIAVAYFKNYLPDFIRKRLDFSQLTQLPGTYLSDELKKTMSDIVYSCALKDKKGTVKVSLLIEHKSHPDKYTPVQVGGYLFSAFQKQIQNKEPLSLVIPVLLYHGNVKWQYRTLANLFEGIDKEWEQFIPSFEYIYNDLGRFSDSEIESLNNKFLAASFLALKHSQEKEWIERNAAGLLILASEGPKGLTKGFIIYLYSRGKLEEKVLNSLPDPIKKDVMNTLDIYIEKGRKEGFEKGIEKGIEKGRIEGRVEGIEKGKEQIVQNLINTAKFTVSEIANLAGVPEAFVKRVRSSMSKKN
jgi:predicted transposase/invertase (TIGR01784 family)